MEQIVRWGWRIPYSFRRNYVSDLGAVYCVPNLCSPWHAWMNASFLLEGTLIAAGTIRLWRHLARGWVGHLAMALLVLCGAGLVAVGFVPEDMDLPVHSAAAVTYFLGGGFGVVLIGFAMLRARRWTAGWISAAVGLSVLAATVVVGQMSHGSEHPEVGAVERVAVYGLTCWFAGIGVWLLRQSRLTKVALRRSAGAGEG